MTRVFSILCVSAFCLGLIVLAAGCQKDRPMEQPLQAARAEAPPSTRGENLFEQGKTKYFPVRFLDEDVVEIHDKWQPNAEEEDAAYYVGQERFDNVVKLIGHLEDLDDAALEHGVVLIQEGTKSRPEWKQDVSQLCIFAEFENINFWFRVPAEAALPETEHAYWFVRATQTQEAAEGETDRIQDE